MRQDLLQWFDRHRRDLPWRRTRDPYAIWLSEVMLQQTRVETVLPYYERFLSRFPTIEDLARAEIDEVLALWSGLGYYRRARQLHAAARRIVELGGFPRTVEGLLELPGIGAYTAAAVASIAFGEAAPVLDGNVERVMARRLGMSEDPKGSAGRKRLLAAAAELLDAGRPGDSNQALMELGATLCTPRRPKCLLCPIARGCAAASEGDPERYPAPRRRRESETHRLVVAVVEEGPRVLLFRRPEESTLLAGTWELPWTESEEPEAALASRYGGRWELGPPAARVRHGITHRDLEVEVRRARLAGAGDRLGEGPEAGWFDASGRAALPMSALVGKVLGALGATLGEALGGAASPSARTRPSRRRR